MARRQREWASRVRLQLIEQLGGKCVRCGEAERDKLQFDHINGRDWLLEGKELSWRISIYRREIAEGKIQLLCGTCNIRKRWELSEVLPEAVSAEELWNPA